MDHVITKAVILAAGMGLRMKDIGEEIPKVSSVLAEVPSLNIH